MTSLCVRTCLLGAALLLGACGGVDHGRPDGDPIDKGEEPDPCAAPVGYEFQNIVDFDPPPGEAPESTRVQQCDAVNRCNINFNYDTALSPTGEPGVPGCPEVKTFTDPGAMQSYLAGTDAGMRCGNAEYATHILATDLATCTSADTGRQGWGGSLSFTFASQTGSDQPFDASEWDGFSFWVKKASARTRDAFIAAAVDPYTAGTMNIEDPFGGEPRSCDASGLTLDPATGERIPDTEKCDGFGVAVTVTDDWVFVPVRFDAMRQKGFGMPSPAGLSTDALVRLQFLMSAGDWDLWIDDVAFFREPSE